MGKWQRDFIPLKRDSLIERIEQHVEGDLLRAVAAGGLAEGHGADVEAPVPPLVRYAAKAASLMTRSSGDSCLGQ